mgnify:CR=1 FL=1
MLGIIIPGVDIGVSIKKELDALVMAVPCCKVKTCKAKHGRSVDVGLSIKKELGALVMATMRGVVQR